MKTLFRSGTWILLASIALAGNAIADEDANQILKKADDIRNPSNSYRLVVQIETAGESEISELDVSIKGKDKTLVKTVKPVRDNGQKMLMVNEEMWSYLPKLKRAVRVQLNQKMSGQASNGDICRQRWSGDYTATIESSDKDGWVLMLTADRPKLTYDKIRLWVKKDYRPDRAEYLTKSGKVLKKAKFQGYKQIAGATRPTETLISNAVKESDNSKIKILKMENTTFPDSMFLESSLK